MDQHGRQTNVAMGHDIPGVLLALCTTNAESTARSYKRNAKQKGKM